MYWDATNCPTILIATTGPWITILGAIFTDCFIVQHLMDYAWVGLDSATNGQHISCAARTFYSLYKGLIRLASYYNPIQYPSFLPAKTHYFPSITAFPNGNQLIYFNYMGFLEDEPDCMALRTQTLTDPPQAIVIKFVKHTEKWHTAYCCTMIMPPNFYTADHHTLRMRILHTDHSIWL